VGIFWAGVIRQNWDDAARAVTGGHPRDYQGEGERLREAFDSRLRVLVTLRKWAGRAEEAGHRVAGAADLEGAIAEVERLRADTLNHWPWPPTPEEVAEAVAEYERGDSLPLDEAFAEIAGVSKEAWLERVEEHKRRRDGRKDAS
jgi:hypothetical protein